MPHQDPQDADPVVLLVDAANVVGSRPDGWWRDRAGAARRLVAQLALLPERVIVVLEGAARDGAPESAGPGVAVHHASGSGDDLLAQLAGPGVLLVTADRELRRRALARGATVTGPRSLLDRLPPPVPRSGPTATPPSEEAP